MTSFRVEPGAAGAVVRGVSARGALAALALTGALLLIVRPGLAQQGPIRLFPEISPAPAETRPAPVEPANPAVDRPAPSVEAVPAPAPPGSSDFRVEGLAAPELDTIGLAGPGDGGFARTLWQGSDGELVMALLAELPVVTRNPALRALTRRLLATGAPLEGSGAPGRLLQARAGRLLAMGDLDGARTLVDPVPPTATDSELVRTAVEVALLTDDTEAACRRAGEVAPTTQAPFWGQVTVYCRLAAGDRSGAGLALDLLRETGQSDDPAFFELAGMLVADAAPAAPAMPEPTAIDVALLRLAELPLPAATLPAATPAVLAAAAREPVLAGEQRLALTERAFALGATSVGTLTALYDDQPDAAAGDLLGRLRTDWGPATRAMAYQAVAAQAEPATRAQLLDATWRAASGPERLLVALGFAKPFAELPVERPLAGAAPSVARALLATDRPVLAVRWLSVLHAEAGQATRMQAEVAGLVPLFALAGVGGSDAVPQLDAASIAAWRLANPQAGSSAEQLFALLEGVGAPIDAVAWRDLRAMPLQRQAVVPAGALWRGLEQAAAARRVGDTVLFALHMLNGEPEAAHPEVLVACLRALRQVGLDRDARAIAVATALTLQL